jgi:hypothetical protein
MKQIYNKSEFQQDYIYHIIMYDNNGVIDSELYSQMLYKTRYEDIRLKDLMYINSKKSQKYYKTFEWSFKWGSQTTKVYEICHKDSPEWRV